MKLPHLLIDLSGHGFGHLSQTATVINRLGEMTDKFHLTLRSTLPESEVRARIRRPFDYIQHELDTGMVMIDALRVDRHRSFEWYQQHHQHQETWLAEEVALLKGLSPDLLFCNIPYISLAAAKQLKIPSLALCSLNWFDILKAYPPDESFGFSLTHQQSMSVSQTKREQQFNQILDFIRQAYTAADLFLLPEPSLPMRQFGNTRKIGPLAEKCQSKRDVLMTQLPDSIEKLVLVGLGGIPADFCTRLWPAMDGVHYLVPGELAGDRKDTHSYSAMGLGFVDLLASVDLVITKTGYGTLVEAVVHQKPVLCIERGDWPEEEVLFPWCRRTGYFESLTFDQFQQGEFKHVLGRLLNQHWEKEPIQATGAEQAADCILERLL